MNKVIKKVKYIDKIINYLLNILIFIIGFILLISIYMGVQTKILGNKYTDFFGYSIFEVQTGSMEPVIKTGDWILVKLTNKVKINDVITYLVDGQFVTHRIIEAYNGTYVTRGDNNNAKDKLPVDQSQIIGVVAKNIGSFGILRKTLFNPPVLIAIIITLFFFNQAFKKQQKKEAQLKEAKTKDSNIKSIAKRIFTSLNAKVTSLKEKKIAIEENQLMTKLEKPLSIPVLTDEETIEENLSKTSLYRVVSVDTDEPKKIEIPLESVAINEEPIIYKDDDLDKTSLFRVISVDSTELNKTLLEIASNDLDNKTTTSIPEEKKEVELVVAPETLVDENITQINLDLFKKKLGTRKSKNIIDGAFLIKTEGIKEIFNILTDSCYPKNNRATFRDIYIKNYVDAKYYNNFGSIKLETNTKNFNIKFHKIVEDSQFVLLKQNKKLEATINIYAQIIMLIADLESAYVSINDFKVKNEYYKKEILKHFKKLDNSVMSNLITKIKKTQRTYNDMIEYYLKSLDTNIFKLNINKINSKQNIYALSLNHNIEFSRVYSNYIIEKTYNEGIIAEDKLNVLISLLSKQLIEDMINGDFNKKYLILVPESLYAKEKKYYKFLKSFDDKYARDNVLILLPTSILIKYKVMLKAIRKDGYNFAIYYDDYKVINGKTKGTLYLGQYIFVNKKDENLNHILSLIPEDHQNNIIYDDILKHFDGEVGD